MKIIISCPNCNTRMRVPEDKRIKFACPNCKEHFEFNNKSKEIIPIKRTNISEETKTTKDVSPTNESNSWGIGGCLLYILSFLITLPFVIIIRRKFPVLNFSSTIVDFVINGFLVLVVSWIIERILKAFRSWVLIPLVIGLGYLAYGSFWGDYGFVSFYDDYKKLIVSVAHSENPEKKIIEALKPVPHKAALKIALDYKEPDVRNYAVNIAKKHFKSYSDDKKHREYLTIIQCFSIFKEINNNWTYVHDPSDTEYFAKASETIRLLAGDCDDHAIVMAACIRAIGGTPRLVFTEEHLYPELLIGKENDCKKVEKLIKELFKMEKSEEIHYHTDDYGNIWLNLDYTKRYPGGYFLGKDVLNTFEF